MQEGETVAAKWVTLEELDQMVDRGEVGLPIAKDWDYAMSEARRNLDWERQFDLAIDPNKARDYRTSSTPEREDTCTMCGKMCAVRNINKILRGEDVDIMD